jgi:hypothetical protein
LAKNVSHAGGNRGGRRVTREVGQRGNTRPRDDKSVRRAREKESSRRLQEAAEAAADHERKLRELEAQLAALPPQPRPAPAATDDALPEAPAPADTEAAALRRAIARESRSWARELLTQGYHLTHVAARTKVPEQELAHLVGPDGYHPDIPD